MAVTGSTIPATEPTMRVDACETDWFGALAGWAAGRGWDVTHEPPSFPMPHLRVIACGVSPRDPEGTHAVVADAETGDIVHDPHPSRAGLASEPRFVLTFVPVTARFIPEEER